MLSHATGVWWMGLTDRRAATVHLSTPRHVRARRGIVVHSRCQLAREWHRGLPVAPVGELLLQYAAAACLDDLRYALSQAQYHDLLDLDEARRACGRGRRGSAKLKAALGRHLPQLAVTASRFERRMLHLCEEHDLPLPECNAWIEGFKVDAVWQEHKLIVELDGKDGHASWDRIRSDHHRDLIHRAAGFTTLRYVWEQFDSHGHLVAADIARAMAR
jgi:hypothetical protein